MSLDNIKFKELPLPLVPSGWECNVNDATVGESKVRRTKLKKVTETAVQVEYDPVRMDEVFGILRDVKQVITVTYYERCYLFPLGKMAYIINPKDPPVSFEGYVKGFKPFETVEGSMEAEITIEVTK